MSIKRLIFVCPSDHLESIINYRFKGENYFHSSLANSVVFDNTTIKEIVTLIESKQIEEIHFVLSDDNQIFYDAFGKQKLADLMGLSDFYAEITKQRLHSTSKWHKENLNKAILSQYLHRKKGELESLLEVYTHLRLKFNIHLYNRKRQVFNKAQSDAIELEISLN